MHSRIFQIGLGPIAKDDYVSPSYFDDDCLDFADYIGDTYTECARKQAAFVKKAMKRGGNILEVTGVSINK